MPNVTLSSDMDAFLTTANDTAARAELGLGGLATVNPGVAVSGILAVDAGTTGGIVEYDGDLGTPASGNLDFCTGLPIGGITGFGTNVAAALGTAMSSTGSIATQAGSETLTNKTIALGSNSISGTIAEFNSACTDADFAKLAANTFTALQTITQASTNAGILASTGYSLTGSNATNMIDLAGTWNTTGVPTGIKLALTETARGANSNYLQILGGTSGTANRVRFYNISATATNAEVAMMLGSGPYEAVLKGGSSYGGGGQFCVARSDVQDRCYFSFGHDGSTNGAVACSEGVIGFSSAASASGNYTLNSADVRLVRDAAAVLALKNSTTAQTLRVYGTTTGSKYLILTHDGTNAILSSSSGGIHIANVNTGFFGATPVAQPSSTGVTTTGFTSGGTTWMAAESTHTGNVGTKAYTFGDVVAHLKTLGLLASS